MYIPTYLLLFVKKKSLVHWTRDWICQSKELETKSDLCESGFNTKKSIYVSIYLDSVGSSSSSRYVVVIF